MSPRFMKTLYLPLLLSLAFLATTALAELLGKPYDDSKPPAIPLPAAYQLAVTRLGSATNQLHCVGACIRRDASGESRWSFTFYDTNTPPKWRGILVDFKGGTAEDTILHN
jgi:hypothetical protein